jgi:hypothetical protein
MFLAVGAPSSLLQTTAAPDRAPLVLRAERWQWTPDRHIAVRR